MKATLGLAIAVAAVGYIYDFHPAYLVGLGLLTLAWAIAVAGAMDRMRNGARPGSADWIRKSGSR